MLLTNMIKHAPVIVVLVGLAILAASCTTVPVAQRDDRVERLITELNTAEPDRLMELTARPFLLDGEIVILESDVRTMWANLREAGFTFHDATIEELGPVTDATYLQFADTMDARVWFEKYAAPDPGLARVDTTHGTFLIVTGDHIGRIRPLPRIFGFTGPEEGRP